MTTKSTLYIKPIHKMAFEMYNKQLSTHKGDSGLDLYILEDVKIHLGETKFIDLGIQCEMVETLPDNTYQNVSYYMYPRSSFSKYPFILGNHTGIIDAGYRGNLIAAIKYLPHIGEINALIEISFLAGLKNKINVTDSIHEMNDNLPCYTIPAGTRLLQICSRHLDPFKFKLVDSLSETSRGSGGFGSTGL
jgi:dUTP pyrophosphatase